MNENRFTSEEFKRIQDEERPQAERLAKYVISTYEPKYVVDVGCATGLYLKPFYEAGINAFGLELEKIPPEITDIPARYIFEINLSQPIPLVPYCNDLAFCLEVLEHIEAEEALVALDNLTKMARRIIFSAAIPGQGGHGHINCQPKEYWLKAFANRGFFYSPSETDNLIEYMKSGYHMGWFTQNAMVMKNI